MKRTWGSWLKSALKARGWTSDMLAAKCGGAIAPSAIRRQITTPDRKPHAASRELIERALGEVYGD